MKSKYLLLLLIIWSCLLFAETTENIQTTPEHVATDAIEPSSQPSPGNVKENLDAEPLKEQTRPVTFNSPFSDSAVSQPKTTGVVGVADFFTTFLALIVILILIAIMAWVLKRSGLVLGKGGQVIKVLATTPVGSKEKLALIEVGKQQVLIGITPTRVSKIITLTESVEIEEPMVTKAPSAFLNSLLKQKNV